MKKVLVLTLCLCFLVGCSKTPTSVIEEVESAEVQSSEMQAQVQDGFVANEVQSEIAIEFPSEADEMNLPDFVIEDDAVGHLYIPTCEISSNIRYGSSMEAVSDNHVGEFECADEIGKGNYSLLGHSNETKKYVFTGMENKLQINDPIYVVKDNKVYEFVTYETFVVDPQDVWILQSTDKPIVTIMCCTNNGTQRFVVRGALAREVELQ